ncbi:14-3-3 protein [Actinomortierella ambigua]|nr:14-3-3 protein [Actinomortierella ambigua]
MNTEIYLAKVAEQADRFDEMARHLSEIAQAGVPFDPERRNLLSVAYKNAVGSRRNALRVVTTLHAKESARGMETRAEDLAKYRKTIEDELDVTCADILKSLDALLNTDPVRSAEDVEANVFYNKMKADYHRYTAEFASGEKRTQASDLAKAAYEAATTTALKLDPTHPIRLGLALNYSVFQYEILNQPREACQTAQAAYDAAGTHNPSVVESESFQDTNLIATLLNDNLMLWTQHNEELERQEAAAAAAAAATAARAAAVPAVPAPAAVAETPAETPVPSALYATKDDPTEEAPRGATPVSEEDD